MNKNKLIPIIICIVLVVVIVYLISSKTIMHGVKSFDHFDIEYNNETNNYDNIEVSDVIIIENVSFWVVSIAGDKIVFNSNENFNNNSESNEFVVELNKDKSICFEKNKCAIFRLS